VDRSNAGFHGLADTTGKAKAKAKASPKGSPYASIIPIFNGLSIESEKFKFRRC